MKPASRRVLALVSLLCLSLLPPRAEAAAELRIAVLEFTNASKDAALDALGKGLQSMVTTDLATLQTLKVVERERLKDVQGELKLARGAGFDKSTAAKLGKLSGASHLFVGSFTVLGEKMRLDGRLIDVGSGDVLLAEQMAGEKALFFELEQQLVQKVIAVLGVKIAPKEKAALARPHTSDFGALRKFSEGIQAFDDGHLEEAMKALNEAKSIDADFKLASLTLGEYEVLSAQVRAKAEAAGHVEKELDRLEKNAAIAKEVGLLKKQWALLDATKGNSPDDKLRRVALLCTMADQYASGFGFRSRGPVSYADLAQAGFDDFTLRRTAEGLFKRAWSEAPDVFPRLPPLCVGLRSMSASNELPIKELLGYHIKDAQKLSEEREVLLSYISNNATVDPASEKLQLDAPAEVQLWEKLYSLSQKLPGLLDEERARFERQIAELRRKAGDFDGSTQMYAAASRHTKDSYKLKEFAKEIDRNKTLKVLLGTQPSLLREAFLLRAAEHDSDLTRLAKPESAKELLGDVERGRRLERRGDVLLLNGLPVWYVSGYDYCTLRSGPRSSNLRATELRYEGRAPSDEKERAKPPVLIASGMRGKSWTVKATIDQSDPPPGFVRFSEKPAGLAEVGVAFAMKRMTPEGSIERGAPLIVVGHAVLVGDGKLSLVQITRDGEHNVTFKRLAEAKIPPGRGKRTLEVKVGASSVEVAVAEARVSLPWKPSAADAQGVAGFIFHGPGYASIAQPSVNVGGN